MADTEDVFLVEIFHEKDPSAKDSLSAYNLQLVKTRISKCLTKHDLCQSAENGSLPKRVVDVAVGRPDGSIGAVLIEPANGIKVPYATLSYCWGKTDFKGTTKKTLADHLRQLKLEDLPSTLQDAITVTRWLGLKYLWIDSLCILQGNKKDWQEESAKMAAIYEDSYITIAATDAVDCNKGFLAKRMWTTSKISLDGHSYSIYFPRYPLFQRGWVLQERLLAARVLHFTETEIFFECGDNTKCECLDDVDWDPEGIREDKKEEEDEEEQEEQEEQEDDGDMGEYENDESRIATLKHKFADRSQSHYLGVWRMVVTNYTSMLLTYDSDMLPAISAIAGRLAPRLGGYIAGLWKDHLPGELLWYPNNKVACRKLHIAPSFSWASVSTKAEGAEVEGAKVEWYPPGC
ncbi:hypothetical protein EG329_011377 [Mollisiaceae sp. DMI_Dod_QoI]|nr:hypothetical protein EG329_011377 [Helotiales sp. DMI_Dod_QoI]